MYYSEMLKMLFTPEMVMTTMVTNFGLSFREAENVVLEAPSLAEVETCLEIEDQGIRVIIVAHLLVDHSIG